jgi:UDP-N-acetylmuramoylalanine--D-glutamate ligase
VEFLATQEYVKKVYCLGSDKGVLSCYEQYASITDLVHAIMQKVSQGDQVLFSPSGSSFDMFKSYKDRGKSFKEEVLSYQKG